MQEGSDILDLELISLYQVFQDGFWKTVERLNGNMNASQLLSGLRLKIQLESISFIILLLIQSIVFNGIW